MPASELSIDLPKWLAKIIRCPVTKERLQPAPSEIIEALKEQQAAGKLVNRMGANVEEPVSVGWINESGTVFHQIQKGIPTLIPGEAISIESESVE